MWKEIDKVISKPDEDEKPSGPQALNDPFQIEMIPKALQCVYGKENKRVILVFFGDEKKTQRIIVHLHKRTAKGMAAQIKQILGRVITLN